MAKTKTGRAAKTKKTGAGKAARKRRRPPVSQWQKGMLGIALLVLLVVSLALLADRMIDLAPPEPPQKPRPPATEPARPTRVPAAAAKRQADPPAAVAPEPARQSAAVPEPSRQGAAVPALETVDRSVPLFEVFPQRNLPAPEEPALPAPPPLDRRPKVAIIIDDLGHNRDMAKKLLDLDPNLTASILPGSAFQKSVVAISRRKGIETMLHLPMEPDEYPAVDPGPGALLASMEPDRLIARLEAELDSLPEAKGVNNHMGSRLTRESSQMQQIFSVLKQRNLYFVDSRTSAQSVGRSTARLFRVPFAERDVFLDHVNTPEFIQGQIKQLIRQANRQGHAVGIAHPHQTTYEVLKQMLPELKRHVRLVPASQVVQSW